MSTEFDPAAYLARNLRQCTDGIDEIARLVSEDANRRECDDPDTAFLLPGSVANLMAAVQQLAGQASTICDDMQELADSRRR
ncbi:hypothetical protein [Halomonas alkalicola]|jgi:hypothetical protein|uniref:hypothetical protein n=1 Tax=Halomonas alkalicola TaxID=1930622 RepID=UPI00265F9CC2|nr:hypothetical protein [Halomonas alkalicola]